MNLQIDIQEQNNADVVYLTGEVDVYTSAKLKESLAPLTEKGQNTLIVDLSQVSYIDSTGLGIFIGALKSVDKAGGTLKISGVNDRVKRLFEITGLNEVIDIDASQREEA
ncbi:STAS domain-containing protein [Bacillus shivajii]|uniref:STAS domain-containing protein n=1 Tax=Bacillus shivajii TaxID=1983719 RepID=UPI001CFBB8A8|nr:STAS domain-containing protein [Bacillus shivajii]UCZ53688.1 STAS domain-containing protein [Bacillus shivajii]